MIELDVIAYLNADATLDGLLSVSGTDTKIYPNQKPLKGGVTPYIIFNSSSDGSREENFKEITMTFNCIHETYPLSKTIRDRVSDLLDRQNEIQNLITSTDYYIYWSKKIGGSDSKETDLDNFNKEVIIKFKYQQKTLP